MGWIGSIFGKHPEPPPAPSRGTPPPSTPVAQGPADSVTLGGAQSRPPAGQPGAPLPVSAQGAPSPVSAPGAPPSVSQPGALSPVSAPGAPPPTSAPAPQGEADKAAAREQEERLRARLQMIESVGRGLSGDYKLGLEAGKAWSYDFGTNTIIYKADDLTARSEDYAIGVILQETGRRTYSRPPTDAAFKDNAALGFLNDTVEGPRVDNLQTSKFAGARQFFQAVYDEDLLNKTEDTIREELEKQLQDTAGLSPEEARKTVMKMKSPVPRHMQYALGVLYDWYTDGKESPDWLRDKNAIRALDATRADYRQAFGLQREIYERDLSPREIIQQASRSEKMVVDKLWPTYKKLLEMDQKDLGQSLFGNGNGQSQNQSGQAGQGQQSQQSQQGQSSSQSGGGQQGQSSSQAGDSQQGQSAKAGNNQQGQGSSQAGGTQQDPGQSSDKQDGAGQAGDKDQANADKKDSQGAGQAGDKDQPNADKKDGQGPGKAGDPQAGASGKPGGGQGTSPMADPKELDTSDGGQLDNSRLTEQQKQKVRDILDKLDKQMDRKVQSKEERDRQDAANAQNGKAEGPDSSGPSGTVGGPPGNGRSNGQIDLPTLQKLLEQKAETERNTENLKSPYEKYYSMLAPYTDEMAGELRNILQENSEPRYIGDFNSGRKLDMHRAMQSQAKYERSGSYDEDIWLRRLDPQKRTYDFVFVLDESGSMMAEERWDNLLKALVLSAEALQTLKIEFSVVGYSDDAIIHKSFEDKYDEIFREQMLARIQASPHANNNEFDALHATMQILDQRPAENQKIVLFITDGLTEATQVTEGLAHAKALGAKMIGVGIGPAMAEVKQLFPESIVAEKVTNLPYLLAEEIRRQIVDGVDQH